MGNHFVGSLELSNHFESYYVLFALCTIAAMRSRKAWVFWVFALLALSVKEDCAAWLLVYAIWEWVFNRENPVVRKRAIKLGALCIAYGLLAGATLLLLSQYQDVNASKYVHRMGGIRIGLDTLMTVVVLIATTGGLCLFNWRAALLILVCLPVIAGNFFVTRDLLYYYSYPVLPFLGLATVAGAASLYQFIQKKRWSVSASSWLLSCALIVTGAVQFPITTRTNDLKRWPHSITGRDSIRKDVAATKLPADVPVAIQYNLWGLVPTHPGAVNLEDGELEDKHYIIADLKGPVNFSTENFVKLLGKLKSQVDGGQRKIIFDAYDFLILSPAIDNGQSVTLAK